MIHRANRAMSKVGQPSTRSAACSAGRPHALPEDALITHQSGDYCWKTCQDGERFIGDLLQRSAPTHFQAHRAIRPAHRADGAPGRASGAVGCAWPAWARPPPPLLVAMIGNGPRLQQRPATPAPGLGLTPGQYSSEERPAGAHRKAGRRLPEACWCWGSGGARRPRARQRAAGRGWQLALRAGLLEVTVVAIGEEREGWPGDARAKDRGEYQPQGQTDSAKQNRRDITAKNHRRVTASVDAASRLDPCGSA